MKHTSVGMAFALILGLLPAAAPARAAADQAAPPQAGAEPAKAAPAPQVRRGPAPPKVLRTDWGAPDLRGMWGGRYMFTLDRNAPMLPAAKAILDAHEPGSDPIARCLPPGIPRVMNMNFPIEIIQTPKIVYFLLEYDHMIRRVFIDQAHPEDPDPNWLGHSVGHWEGNTLVVDTVGLNDKTWLDEQGHPHSENMHVIERFTRSEDGKTLNHEITIDDPTMYRQAWGTKKSYQLRPDERIMEWICRVHE